MKRKHGKSSSVEDTELDEEVTTVEYTEISFSLSFIISLLYRPVIMDKYVFYAVVSRYIYLLYNYKFLSEDINYSLYDYFNFMIEYVDDTPNLTNDVEYNDRHREELLHTLRPRLFNVQLFEILNRILHNPSALPPETPDPTARRLDLEKLGSLAKKVVRFCLNF